MLRAWRMRARSPRATRGTVFVGSRLVGNVYAITNKDGKTHGQDLLRRVSIGRTA